MYLAELMEKPQSLWKARLCATHYPLCYTAEVVTLLGVAELHWGIPTAQSAASKGVFAVPPVRLTTMVKAAG